jgi:branched-chain amino acid transport system ATP-binding protein
MTESTMLQARNITRTYGDLVALDNVSVDIPAGMVTGLIGPNGAGKSTLLSVMSGCERPVSGQILLGGADITSAPGYRRVGLGITRTFQDVEIFPTLTVLENVMLAFQEQKGEQLWRLLLTPREVRRQRDQFIDQSLEILKTVSIIDKRPNELAGNLSYGQQKLLALARMLPTDADFFMLDEPGSGLPRPMVAHMGQLLRQIARDHGKGVVLVDHNMELVLEYAERVIVMHHGTVLAQGTPEYVRRHPDVIRVYLSRLEEESETNDKRVAVGGSHA